MTCTFTAPGSCVLIYKEDNPNGDPFILHISGWRGTSSLRSYMSQHSTVHFLRLLGGDVSKYGKYFLLFMLHVTDAKYVFFK